jgi:hypothetical protein
VTVARWPAALMAGLLAVPLLAHAYVGLYSRYAADDYCTAGQVATRGLLGLELTLYEVWSGRFAFTFFVGLAELIGPGATRVLPGLALAAWVAALTWAISRVGLLLGWRRPILDGLVLGELIVFATLSSTVDVGQSLYWQTGMLTYLAPLVAAAVYAGLLLDRVRVGCVGWLLVGVAGALAFVAGGTSETYVAAQTAALGAAIATSHLFADARARRVLLRLLVAGLIGSVLAFGIVALAPGNAVRAGGSPAPSIGFAVGSALDDARQFVHDFWRFTTLSFAVALFGPAALALVSPPAAHGRGDVARLAVSGGLLVMIGLALVVVCLAPSFYALSSPAPGRARIIPQLVLVAVTASAGYASGAMLSAVVPRPRAVRVAGGVVVVGLILTGSLLTARRVLAETADAQAYAERWDGIDAQVRAERASGEQDVVVPTLPPTGTIRGMDFVGPDPSDWLNVCVARFYRVRSITAHPN